MVQTNQTKNILSEVFFSRGWGWASVCVFSLSLFLNTKTLANQELGHTPWPLASLSQGDLLRKALRLETLD